MSLLPPVQQTLEGASAVTNIVGTRIAQGIMPEGETRPYVTWQIVSNVPTLNLSDLPEVDDERIMVDCYAASQSVASALAIAVRNALEAVTHVVFGPVYFYEADTKLHRWTMDPEFWNPH